MNKATQNINTDWQTLENQRGETLRMRDLSGERLGVRLEELPPGGTSSEHHYHTAEEEHLIVLAGHATLVWGDTEQPLQADDHVWFRAAEPVAHHIRNTSDEPFKFLVFGERNNNDVVVYPNHQVMMLKAHPNDEGGYQLVTFRPVSND